MGSLLQCLHSVALAALTMSAGGCADIEALQSSVILSPDEDVNAPSSAGFSGTIETDAHGVHIIHNHGGGRIITVEAERRRLLNWQGPVKISGYCNSACVILTTLPNACIERGAHIGFHSSNVNFGPVGNQQIARYLRGDLKSKFLEEWQFVPHTEIHHITATRLAALDPEIELCQS